jgi:hypothetical protein
MNDLTADTVAAAAKHSHYLTADELDALAARAVATAQQTQQDIEKLIEDVGRPFREEAQRAVDHALASQASMKVVTDAFRREGDGLLDMVTDALAKSESIREIARAVQARHGS